MTKEVNGGQFVLPAAPQVQHARSSLFQSLPINGVGLEKVAQHLHHDLVPGLNRSSQSPNYYGFVTGGVTPAAGLADNLVTEHDQNLGVHLPDDGVATDVEDRALSMICELLELTPTDWPHRTFSTGATASNVLGLACGREYVVREAAAAVGKEVSVGEDGIYGAMRTARIDAIQILTTVPHSSLCKAASIVGLGRASVRDVGLSNAPHRFDMAALRKALSEPGQASIVAVSFAEVNAGLFATSGDEMKQIRSLCDQYGAWVHVDAAFGLLARVLPADEKFAQLREGVEGLELADSITGDAHKLLNVPYDCGIFLSRHLALGTQVFQNPNAAYLDTSAVTIPSPLHVGIENSRRFRALPVYATLAAYGRAWYAEMLGRQIELARQIARYVDASDGYELLPTGGATDPDARLARVYIVVPFRARDQSVNGDLVRRINRQRRLYVSGTRWEGGPAARFAVANWQVDVDRDFEIVKEVLESALL